MNRTTLSVLLGLAIVAAPAANAAESDLSYTYVEANYLKTDVDVDADLDASTNGFGAAGSVAFGETGLFGFGAYDTVGDDIDGVDVDINRTTLGVGYAFAIDENFHWVSEAAYLNYELEVGFDGFNDSVDADGYRVSTGLRSMLADNIEGIAKIGYISVEEDGLEVFDGGVGELGLRWHINKAFSAGLVAEIASDETTYKLGMRAQF